MFVVTVLTSVGATVFGELRLRLLLGAVGVSAMWLRAGLAACLQSSGQALLTPALRAGLYLW